MVQNKNVLLLKMQALLPSLNPALRKIGEYILEHPAAVKLLRIGELAGRCGVADATVTRFVRTIGLASFQELKINLAELCDNRSSSDRMVYEEVTRSDPIDRIAKKIFTSTGKALQDTMNIVDIRAIEQAIDVIEKAKNIDIYAAGGSFIAAENARLRLYRIGKRCNTYNDPNQQIVSASLLTAGDAAIGISNSGRTLSTFNAIKCSRDSGATTIALTSFDQTPITLHADIVLFTSTRDSAFFQESMVSRMAQMFVLDIIYAGLAVRRFDHSVKMIKKSAEALRGAFCGRPVKGRAGQLLRKSTPR